MYTCVLQPDGAGEVADVPRDCSETCKHRQLQVISAVSRGCPDNRLQQSRVLACRGMIIRCTILDGDATDILRTLMLGKQTVHKLVHGPLPARVTAATMRQGIENGLQQNVPLSNVQGSEARLSL